MSKQPSDSFLPSGAIDSPRRTFGRSDSLAAAMSVPRSVPDYIPSPHDSGEPSPSLNSFKQSRSPSQHTPISPPKTRSTSADDLSAGLIEDWRAYTDKLRSQHEGERAHMEADRARVEEVMAEERALWDKERDMLKARIAELEAQLGNGGSSSANTFIPQATIHQTLRSFAAQNVRGLTSPPSHAMSATGSTDGSSSRSVPQESGRNADGSPFYAPAPRNPSRTFDASEGGELRVDSITAPRESAIRVTSKELKSSDFGVQSPGSELETVPESPVESIDISHIQPELEGVSIKVSAVSPTFAAKVLSPQRSPPRLGGDVAAGRDITNFDRNYSRAEEKDNRTLEVVFEPENRRLTMHAGHTPNHSISKFPFLGPDGESGNATPTQHTHQHVHTEHCPHGEKKSPPREDEQLSDDLENGDKELTGPLSLPADQIPDDPFLAQLTEKLEEVERKSRDVSPSSASSSSQERILSPKRARNLIRGSRIAGDRGLSGSRERDEDDADDDKDEGPVLRLKPSFNFGRPLGSM